MSRRRPNFYYHLHPPTIPEREVGFFYTFGLGGISLLLFLVLGVTGAIEMFLYVPTPQGAHESIRLITYRAPYGWLLRNLHYWAGQAMLGTVVLHMARVVLSGGYKARRLNWLIGVALLAITFVFNFTGFVLRWDQDTAWALMVGTNLVREIPVAGPALYRLLVGGAAIGEPALIRFYTWHVFGLTLLSGGLIAWHLFRVRRDGGISARASSPRRSRAHLVRLEVLGALLAMVALVALSLAFDAPLTAPVDPGAVVTEPKAPWFFLWIQELLRVAPPFLAGVAIPIAILVLLGLLPYTLDRTPSGMAEWFNRPGRLAQIIFLVIFITVLALTLRGCLR
jgi:quinol-cytochrome oxidoreductase complex cytochrome b subunit